MGVERVWSPSPDVFERASDMTRLFANSDLEDDLEVWIKSKVFSLEKDETLPQYWLR